MIRNYYFGFNDVHLNHFSKSFPQSENIAVGDIVRVRRDEQFPADLVIISTSSSSGKCFVMTANLDGETNLKPLFASKETKDCCTEELLGNLQAEIECENPNTDLLSFKGRLVRRRISGQSAVSLGLENIALRGTQLRQGKRILETSLDLLESRNIHFFSLFLNIPSGTRILYSAAPSTQALIPRCP